MMFNPINGLAALAAVVRRSPMRLLWILTVVPAETKIPFTVDEALLPEILQMVFLKTLVVVAPETTMPLTADATVDARVLIALLLMLINVEVFEQVIPVTEPCPVILVIVFVERLETPFQ